MSARSHASSLPLAGVKVLDLTRILAGPFATQRLGDLGAEIVKVENPDGGDDTRGWGPPFVNGVSTYFFSLNRNKRSVALDLKSQAGKDVLWRLVERSDVLVENFRPGTLERLGFGWEALRERAPRLVYCSVSGYGHAGKMAERASFDVVIQGEAGAMDLTGDPHGPPTKCGISIADCVAGLHAVEGITAALYARERTGRGDRVDVALFDGILSILTYQAQMWLACGKAPRRLGNAHPSIVPYETFRTSDGYINIGVGSEGLWARFCEALGAPEWRADPLFSTNQLRVVNREELKPRIEARLAGATSADWYARLDAAGVPCGLVRPVAEALGLAEEDIREMIIPVEHPDAGRVKMVGNPVKIGGLGGTPAMPPPRLGEHTEEVLRGAGFRDDEIQKLKTAKVIGDRNG
ncbi:MAG TPA: CoA transferase [Planctomycetota bacterium]|nr:CoA transferase [Planctomycetota bacterium]